jgi:hypothetical protein
MMGVSHDVSDVDSEDGNKSYQFVNTEQLFPLVC